jgi:hypothetical protein
MIDSDFVPKASHRDTRPGPWVPFDVDVACIDVSAACDVKDVRVAVGYVTVDPQYRFYVPVYSERLFGTHRKTLKHQSMVMANMVR